MSRLVVTGDIHGKAAKRFAANEEYINKDDVVVICGDFGIPFGIDNPFIPQENRYRQCAEATWLNNQPWTTIALCGNHDDRNAIRRMPLQLFDTEDFEGVGRVLQFDGIVYSNIIIIDEPCLWKICGKTCLMIPGASSHDVIPDQRIGIINPYDHYDKDMSVWEQKLIYALQEARNNFPFTNTVLTTRLEGWSWWEDEDVDIEKLTDIILEYELYDKHIDYIFSHEAPLTALQENNTGIYGLLRERHLPVTITPAMEYLSDLYYNLDFDHWFTGHYHTDKTWLDNISTLYYNIIIADEENRNIGDVWTGVTYGSVANQGVWF